MGIKGTDLKAESSDVGGGDDVRRMRSKGREEEGDKGCINMATLADLKKEVNVLLVLHSVPVKLLH